MLRIGCALVMIGAIAIAPQVRAQEASSLPPGLACEMFHKNPDGSWTANKQATIRNQAGRMETLDPAMALKPGTEILGFDVAGSLNAHCH